MKRNLYFYALVLGGLLLALVLSVVLGAVNIPLRAVVDILGARASAAETDWPASFVAIIQHVRLPHTILIALSGAALAGSGAAYQGLFRNPLADPYLIGVASGAGLGAVIGLSLPFADNPLGMYFVPAVAFLGAIVTVVVVYNMARVNGFVPLTTLILAGVAAGSFMSALSSFLMLRSNEQILRAFSFLLGGSPVSGWEPVLAILPYMLVGLTLLAFCGHPLNVLQFGEDQARQMGLNVGRTKVFIILVASLTTAAAVAFSGVIGFIGLVVPHIFRIIWGPDYRHLIILSMLGGVSVLLLADVIARIIIAPASLPVGIVTALVGAPFFMWILRRAKREVFW
jgi:iron complex transport system permease protein